MFDVGIYGSYQSGSNKSTPSFYKMDEYNLPISECQGKYELRTEAYAIGLNSTLYFNPFLFDQKKETFANRIQLGIEVAAGLGFSKVISDLQPPRGSTASKEFLYYNSQDFQGKIGLKVEYNFTKQPLITSLGLKGGYQYFKTKTVKDRLGNEWTVDDKHPINLNFSGVYFGVYLKLGNRES